MSEMLNMVVGRLERDTKIVPDFKGNSTTKNYIVTEGDDGFDRDARVPVIAWGKEAEELTLYKKGDLVHLLCVPTDHMVQIEDKYISTLGFKVVLVDHECKISKEINKKILEILNE